MSSVDADVCVIGAGPAGALCAHRLAARGHSVVVLEAGPRFESNREQRMEAFIRPEGDALDVWGMGGTRDGFSSTGKRAYPLNHARVKGVGGATLHWQGMVMRLHETDFARRTHDGYGADWPLSYHDLRPYYAQAERALGVAGAADNPFSPPRKEPFPLPAFRPSYSDSLFAEACEDLGVIMHSTGNARNSEPRNGQSACMGYGTCKPVCPSGAKYTAERHIEMAETAGARVITEAPVQRLETDSSSERVRRAIYVKANDEHGLTARQFVLAAGGVETPRLLLLSASDSHPDGLANSSGVVGKFFMDHLYAGMGGTLSRPTRQKQVGFLTSECHQFYDDPGRRTQGTNGGIPESDADIGPIKLEFSNYAGPSPVDTALDSHQWGDALLEEIRDSYGSHIAMGALCGQPPRAENRIALDSSQTDDHGNPVPDVQWSLGTRTRRTLARANEIQRAILTALGADIQWQVGPDDTGPAFHHMGTTRMGEDPARSVVNSRLRTHDVENLTIPSSSVFPTSGSMNPTLTIAALALKATDHIAADLPS